jgi:signal transduction histidine kinase
VAGVAAGLPRSILALSDLERSVLFMLAQNEPLPRVLEELALGLERVASAGTIASVLLLDEEQRVLRHGAAPRLPAEYQRAIDGTAIGPSAGSCGTAAYRNDCVIVSDIANDPLWDEFRDHALPHGLHACWSMPVVSSTGTVLGTLAFYHREPRSPSADDLAAIDSSARLVRVVLERVRNDRARTRAARREAALYAAARVLAESESVPSALHGVLEAVAQALACQAAVAWLLIPEQGALTCAAHWSSSPETLGPFMAVACQRDRALDEAVAGEVLGSGEPAWFTIDGDSRFVGAELALACGLRAGFALPIRSEQQTLGSVELFVSNPEDRDPDLLRALSTVGLQVGQFIQRARAQEESARLLQELRETVRFSELFAGVLAHDLRNPLNSISMGTELLIQSELGERGRSTLQRMRVSAERMARMIGQLLDLTRSRSGDGIAVVCQRFDLRELARSVADELTLATAPRHVTIEVAGETSGEWDEDRLGQVLSNLVSNALEHGAPGSVPHVSIDGSDAARVRVEVRNAGTISPDNLPWLFDPFRRARTDTHSLSGLGLGLYITRQIVLAHGGTIDVESNAAGTVFRVELPRRPC